MDNSRKRRVTIKPKCPNPLFEQWLTEWRDKAKESESKMQYTFSTALKSLQKYPLPLETGKDCKILHGFGEKLCKMLDNKLVQYKCGQIVVEPQPTNDEPPRPKTKRATKPKAASPRKGQSDVPSSPEKKEYIPKYRSGPFAILITLYENSLKGGDSKQMTKAEIIAKGQNLCDVSFTKPGPDSRYTGWSSMRTLLEKKLVTKEDLQEVNGGNSNQENEPILQELTKLNVKFETRNLKVGDYVWICRDNTNIELVLPYIVERKRMDDFAKSIKDNRFHEQKFRLKQCGLQNLIYLVESYGKNEQIGIPFNSLLQATANTLIQDEFNVKFTENVRETCQYLANFTTLLTNLFKAKTLVSCQKEDLTEVLLDDDLVTLMNFIQFNKSSSKNRHFTVREMFIRQLLKIKGVSVDKAVAIVTNYETPTILRQAYKEINQVQGEKLLSTIQYGVLQKKLGLVLSKSIYQLFCKDSY